MFLFRYQGDANNDNWIRVEVPLDSPRKFSIEFAATMGSGEKGDIVLDDISFSSGCSIGGKASGGRLLIHLLIHVLTT
jgi:hypothetical protein